MVEEVTNPAACTQRGALAWLRLHRAVRMAFDLRKVVLGALGLVLLQAGWTVLDQVFPQSADVTPDVIDWSRIAGAGSDRDGDLTAWPLIGSAGWRLLEPARMLATPLRSLFALGKGGAWTLHALLAVLWTIAVWGIFGGAIARVALVQVARMHGLSIAGAVRFALRFGAPLIGTPLCPFLGVGLCALVCAGFGLVYRLPAGIGGVLGGMLLFLPIAAGLVMSIMLLGLVAAWPLMHASVAAEAEDTLDALSRSFSYLNQRLGKLAGFLATAWLIGLPARLAVDALAMVVVHLTTWGLSLSAPASSLGGLGFPNPVDATIPQTTAAFQAFWRGIVGLLAQGWTYGYFWTAASLIYLLLRHDVDGTPWTEVRDVASPSSGAPTSRAR